MRDPVLGTGTSSLRATPLLVAAITVALLFSVTSLVQHRAVSDALPALVASGLLSTAACALLAVGVVRPRLLQHGPTVWIVVALLAAEHPIRLAADVPIFWAGVPWTSFASAILCAVLFAYRPPTTVALLAGIVVAAGGLSTAMGLAGEPAVRLATALIMSVAPPLVTTAGIGVALERSRRRWALLERAARLRAADRAAEARGRILGTVQTERFRIVDEDIAPLLRGLLETGEVTPADRARAADVDARTRRVMLAEVERSWLEGLLAGDDRDLATRVAVASPVDDPTGASGDLSSSQRIALRAAVNRIRAHPAVERGSVRIAMRPRDTDVQVVLRCRLSDDDARLKTDIGPHLSLLRGTFDRVEYELDERILTLRFCFDQP